MEGNGNRTFTRRSRGSYGTMLSSTARAAFGVITQGMRVQHMKTPRNLRCQEERGRSRKCGPRIRKGADAENPAIDSHNASLRQPLHSTPELGPKLFIDPCVLAVGAIPQPCLLVAQCLKLAIEAHVKPDCGGGTTKEASKGCFLRCLLFDCVYLGLDMLHCCF